MNPPLRHSFFALLVFLGAGQALAQVEVNPAVIKKVEIYLAFRINDLELGQGIKLSSISGVSKIYHMRGTICGVQKAYEGMIITHVSNRVFYSLKKAIPIINKEDFIKVLIAYKQNLKEKIIAYEAAEGCAYAIDISGLNIDELKKASAEFTSNAETKQPEDVVSKNTNPPSSDTMYRGSGDPLKGLNVSKAKEITSGNYYALIVGIDKYSGQWMPLKNAVHDAKTIENTLREKYKMNSFYTLYDEKATRAAIMNVLENLVNTLKEDDNILIYFSGHGEYKKTMNKGYWVPYDAKTNSVSDLISNNDIQTFLSSIQTKHTLLISDACFSGDIFRGNTISIPFEESEKYYTKVYNKNSRQALTSGGVEPVMDGGKEGHSVFTYYLLKSLNGNEKKYLDAGQLYNDIKIAVVNNSDQTPLLNPVKDTGDEGGQFIFIRK